MKNQKYYINRQDKAIPLSDLYNKIFRYNIFIIIFLNINIIITFEYSYFILASQILLFVYFYINNQKIYLQYLDYKRLLFLIPFIYIFSHFISLFIISLEILFIFLLLINYKKKFNFFYKKNDLEEWIIDYKLNAPDILFKDFKSYKITLGDDVRDGFLVLKSYTKFHLDEGNYWFAVADEEETEVTIQVINNGNTIFNKTTDAFEIGWNEFQINGGEVEIYIEGNTENLYFQIPKRINKRNNPKTIILVVSDALTKSDMSIYGGNVKVPHIENFFKNGLIYNDFYCQGEWTTTNFIHILTGFYSSIHKSTHRFLNHKKDFRDFNTFPSLLKENGFNTFSYSTSKRMGVKFGYTKGFDKTLFKGYKEVTNSDITYEAINFLNQHKNENNFLLLHYMDNHGPFKHWSFFKNYNAGLRKKRINNIYRKDKDFYDVYKNTIREFDLGIGVLFGYLDSNIINANVLLTADHGQFIQIPKTDKIGTIEPLLSKMMVNIPLLVKTHNSTEQTINGLCEAIDLFATILDIANVKYTHLYSKSLIHNFHGKEFSITESIYEGNTQRMIITNELIYYKKFNWYTKEEEIKIIEKSTNKYLKDSTKIQYFENIETEYKLMKKEDDYTEFYGEY